MAALAPLALGGCGETARLRLIGALSYANTYASEPSLIFEGFKSRFTDPFALETVPAKTLVDDIAAGRDVGAFVRDVPFYMQARYGCGAAALAGALAHLGAGVELDDITRQIVVPQIGGALCTDMVAYPRTKGFWSEQHPGSERLLCWHLTAGRPAVCLLGSGIVSFAGHYVLVTACAPGRGVVCHNGFKASVFMPWKEFDALWSASQRWMMIVCAPEDVDWELSGKLRNELGRLLHRRGMWKKALEKYEAALKPETQPGAKARITYNIGLAQFALGRLEQAQEAFGKALELDPKLPDAANALAYTYATLGTKLDEAELLARRALTKLSEVKSLARRALAGDPEKIALYLDTLGFVLHRLGKNDEARAALERALASATEDDGELAAEIYYHLGLSCEEGAEREAALRKSVELAPESTQGRRAAALLKGGQKERKSR